MKYFLIAGEASGDLHGAQLIKAIAKQDSEAQFSFFGGDQMAEAAGCEPITHYRDMAFMGFIEVAKHLPAILGFMRTAKRTIDDWHPDRVVLIDYPSFNLKIARHAHARSVQVHYFISPKVWVWKEWRVKDIKQYVDRMYCILPFEPAWYAQRDYQAEYVGNPTKQEISQAMSAMPSREAFCANHGLDATRTIIALLPGSRVKEIRDNLPTMLGAARHFLDCQLAIAAAPNIAPEFYAQLAGDGVTLVKGATWPLLRHSRVAIVTSGTATLETALIGTPQIACYRMTGKKWLYNFYRKLIKGKYATLPNLIADEEVIPELLVHHCTVEAIDWHLNVLLPNTAQRQAQIEGYRRVSELLGESECPYKAAQLITTN